MSDIGDFEDLRRLLDRLHDKIELLRRQIGPFITRLGPQEETPEQLRERLEAAVVRLVNDVGKEVPPVDRTKLCTTDGRPPEEARASQTNETGQHQSYIVLCEEERKKGFVRPYRDRYKHVGREEDIVNGETGAFVQRVRLGGCGSVTTMGRALSETYARDPKFYGATFCCGCNRHLPVEEFVWTADGQVVGS